MNSSDRVLLLSIGMVVALFALLGYYVYAEGIDERNTVVELALGGITPMDYSCSRVEDFSSDQRSLCELYLRGDRE
tara:strand:- start:826 stop:1053 length:228 start_codon:yes stop_codon:yes gene_type:complete